MTLENTGVTFQTSDSMVQKLYDTAEGKCLENIKDFAGRKVLIEGGGYEKIWLETQPMGGEMYAKRDMEAGLNNQLLFMETQREDGRIPGSIAMINGVLTPQFNKFQGFCFPAPALNMYYLTGKDRTYLEQLYDTLERFDAYLWAARDSDNDGCLESFCKYDTGEDHAMRYYDAPDAWEEETPPTGCKVVPMASMDIMSYSYSARNTLAQISRIFMEEKYSMEEKHSRKERHSMVEKHSGEEKYFGKDKFSRENWEVVWRQKALMVQQKMKDYLWNEEKGALYDRDKSHKEMPVLIHNNLRTMYWNSITPVMAKRFVEEHLLNPREFWTTMPLPSVAANDPLFRNVTTNNWSGQAEALTYQRAIRALENYDYQWILPALGKKLFQAIGEECVFVQQYDPFTGRPSAVSLEGKQDAYGPAMLSVLEYISRMYGVHLEKDVIYWGTVGGNESVYEQVWGDQTYRLENGKNGGTGYLNGKKIFKVEADLQVITDTNGDIRRINKLGAYTGLL